MFVLRCSAQKSIQNDRPSISIEAYALNTLAEYLISHDLVDFHSADDILRMPNFNSSASNFSIAVKCNAEIQQTGVVLTLNGTIGNVSPYLLVWPLSVRRGHFPPLKRRILLGLNFPTKKQQEEEFSPRSQQIVDRYVAHILSKFLKATSVLKKSRYSTRELSTRDDIIRRMLDPHLLMYLQERYSIDSSNMDSLCNALKSSGYLPAEIVLMLEFIIRSIED